MRFSFMAFIFAPIIPLATAAPRTVQENMGTSISISRHTPFSNTTRKYVDFDALDAHVAFVRAKVRQSIANYERHTGKKYPFSTDRFEKRDHHIVLTDMNTDFWFGIASVGTPAEDYKVVFDTGSGDFFLSSVLCDWTCDGHARWDPRRSSTSVELRQPFVLDYEDGSNANGDLYNDTVTLAGFTAISQTIGAAKTVSKGFQMPGFTADGLMGMAFESTSKYPARPVFETLVSQGHARPIFSFKLSDSTTESELYVGGVNTALYVGDLVFLDVTVPALWQIKMDNIQWNGVAILSSLEAEIDTGANLVIGPIEQVSKLYDTLGGTPVDSTIGHYIPCDRMPLISFCFGGTAFPISLKTFNIGLVGEDSEFCVGGIVGVDMTENIWFIGNVFLQNVYTMFDTQNKVVGFARLA